MPPGGDKSKYLVKQERKVDQIAEGYEKLGAFEKETDRALGRQRRWRRQERKAALVAANTGHPSARNELRELYLSHALASLAKEIGLRRSRNLAWMILMVIPPPGRKRHRTRVK